MTSDLVVTSFNVGLLDVFFFGRKLFEFAPDTRRRAAILPQILAKHECHVLCVQELFQESDQRDISRSLRSAFPHQVIARNRRGHVGLSTGLAVFSRFPLRDVTEKRFGSQIAHERIAGPKGVLVGELLHPTLGGLQLLNAHTTAGGFLSHPESARANAVRGKQLGEMAALSAPPDVPTLLCGDLNCGPEASPENYRALLEAGFIDVGSPGTELEFAL